MITMHMSMIKLRPVSLRPLPPRRCTVTKETLEKFDLNKIKNSRRRESSEPQENAAAANKNVGKLGKASFVAPKLVLTSDVVSIRKLDLGRREQKK